MSMPSVSVIVPVYNARPWLADCLGSIGSQTYGAENVEVIVVDDLSTDGSWEEINRLAANLPRFQSYRLPANSGGAGHPRNAGLNRATGTYVFFMDADDYLGDEALERMITMAEQESSDIVLGKVAAPPGQENRALMSVFRRSIPKATLFNSPVYGSLGPWKLFRRALVEQYGLRFLGLPRWDDVIFTNHCYLHARVISVVADYDCYFLRDRSDGSSVSQQQPDSAGRLAVAEELIRAVTSHIPAGAKRDHLVRQHVRLSILPAFGEYWLSELPDPEQRAIFDQATALLSQCVNENVLTALHPRWRRHANLVAGGDFDEFREALSTFLRSELRAC